MLERGCKAGAQLWNWPGKPRSFTKGLMKTRRIGQAFWGHWCLDVWMNWKSRLDVGLLADLLRPSLRVYLTSWYPFLIARVSLDPGPQAVPISRVLPVSPIPLVHFKFHRDSTNKKYGRILWNGMFNDYNYNGDIIWAYPLVKNGLLWKSQLKKRVYHRTELNGPWLL